MKPFDRLVAFRTVRKAPEITDAALQQQADQAETVAKRLQGEAAVVLMRDRTGAGKTVVSVAAATLLLEAGHARRIAIVAPNKAVCKRWAETARDFHAPAAVEQWHFATRRNMPAGQAFDLVIIDEAHRGLQSDGAYHRNLSEYVGRARLLLVTATPFQLSTEGLIRMLTLGQRVFDGVAHIRHYGAAVTQTLHAWRRAGEDLDDEALTEARDDLAKKLPEAQRALESVSPPIMPDVVAPGTPTLIEVPMPPAWQVAYHTARITPELLEGVKAGDMFQRRLCSSSEAFWTGRVGTLLRADQRAPVKAFVAALQQDLGTSTQHPKIAGTLQWIQTRRDRHVLVFCTFVETQRAIAAALEGAGIDHVAPKDHSEVTDKVLQRFCTPPPEMAPLVLVARDNLSESIDLDRGEAALLHHDLPWNPARLTQRWGRLVRRRSGFKPVPDEHHAAVVLPVEIDRRIAEVVRKRSHQADWMMPESGDEDDVPWAVLLGPREA